jgi:SAM-dependent methyltransferase
MDLSEAVVAAHANLGDRVRIIQADLFHAPFAPGTFDIVYSIGVLHHTPDTKAATKAIASLVKPGGILAIWVYPPGPTNVTSDLYRRVTTRLDPRTLYRLIRLVGRLHPLRRVRVLRFFLAYLLPASTEDDPTWRLLDTFDWYAPLYQWKHTTAEGVGWFDDLGFEDIEVVGPAVGVRGRRPMRPSISRAGATMDAPT